MSKRLIRSTSLVSFNTFLSRILGFVRDVVLAQTFGAVAGFDAFVVAFKIPNFTRRLFAEGAFSQAFVPVLSEYQKKHSPEQTRQFMDRTAGALGSALLTFVFVAEIITPLLIMIFAPGFYDEPARFDLATQMLRITLPYMFLISMVAFAGAIMNCHGQFGVPAFTPVLLNVALIFAALVIAPYFHISVVALAWGVVLGGVLQLLFQIPFLYRKNILPRPCWVWGDEGVRRVLKLMVPALFGVSIAQISLLVDTLFASFLPAGSISWLYYSDRLTFFPLGVFGVALATVVLPHLSRQHASESPAQFSKTIDWSLRCVLVVGLPAAVGLFLLSGPLLTTLFQYGRFTVFAVMMARRSLMAFAVGLPFFMLIKVLASAFYSRQEIKIPVRIAAVALTVDLVLNVVLIFPMAHAGLALATSIGAFANAGLLLRALIKRKIFNVGAGWQKFLFQLIFANGVMGLMLYFMVPGQNEWFTWMWPQRFMHLLFWVGAAMLAYFVSLYFSGIRIRHFYYKASDGTHS